MADVVLQNINKFYQRGSIHAVKDVSFEVGEGELFGLIGPDGAGKSSIFRILTTLILPDTGSARVHGMDIRKDYKSIRRRIGYMPGRFSLYPDLSAEENLRFFATVFNTTIRENYHLIKDIYAQLAPFKDRRAGQLSGGMKQKLALCCALIHRPLVLFLDEPTTGVDVVSRREFWEMLKQLRDQGITILVSTPYMDEATRCERIALIQNGTILSINTPAEAIARYPHKLFSIRSGDMGQLLNDLRTIPYLNSCYAFGSVHHISFSNPSSTQPADLIRRLEAAGHVLIELKPIEPTIEDCFIWLMTRN